MEKARIELPKDKIADFCKKWKVQEFALFGSVLRDDFMPESDVDVLVDFEPDARRSLLDIGTMVDDLQIGRCKNLPFSVRCLEMISCPRAMLMSSWILNPMHGGLYLI